MRVPDHTRIRSERVTHDAKIDRIVLPGPVAVTQCLSPAFIWRDTIIGGKMVLISHSPAFTQEPSLMLQRAFSLLIPPVFSTFLWFMITCCKHTNLKVKAFSFPYKGLKSEFQMVSFDQKAGRMSLITKHKCHKNRPSGGQNMHSMKGRSSLSTQSIC